MFWFLALLFLFLWLFARYALAGPDLSRFDTPIGETFAAHSDDAKASQRFLRVFKEVRKSASSTRSLKKGFGVACEFADQLSDFLDSDCQFENVVANKVNCEWTIAPNANSKRRILFLHGGAFLFGSPKGHRFFTHSLSHLANAAVLSVDYRLMPKHKRMHASEDAQSAYQWILENGPNGAEKLDLLMVAGDSAGGNLALMLSGWSKANAARQPDAVIGFSPTLDSTLGGPSFLQNHRSDKVLGNSIGLMARLPTTLRLWLGLALFRAKPNNTIQSPLFGELDNLPPSLIHASSSEVLLSDAIRYTNKAQAAGSDVSLQIWEDQLHDWHLFTHDSGSGKQAWAEVAKFVSRF